MAKKRKYPDVAYPFTIEVGGMSYRSRMKVRKNIAKQLRIIADHIQEGFDQVTFDDTEFTLRIEWDGIKNPDRT